MMRAFIFLLLFSLIGLAAVGQERVTVKDPEIVFSIMVPEGWRTYDDEYYFYVVPPGSSADNYVFITYLTTNEKDVSKAYEFTINSVLPLNEGEFTLLQEGEARIDSIPARWLLFESVVGGVRFKSIAYLFIQHGQLFTARGLAQPEQFEHYKEQFRAVIQSLEAQKL